jgi:2-polyprenyl-3-methyl-5-hydroxy-6-metoxy-1,4-benzoquinol methylase
MSASSSKKKPPFPEISFEDRLKAAVQLIGPHEQPNINALSEIVRNLPGICFSVKNMGYEVARSLAAGLPAGKTNARHVGLKSKASTQADLESDWARHWCNELGMRLIFHRKVWELAYAMQAIYENGMMTPGKRGVGFGCGEEALPSYFAAKGVDILVTDLAPDDARASGWANTAQHTKGPDSAFHPHLVDRKTFDEKVRLQYVDMNDIPSSVRDYDFCWSICALEHLGTIENGLNFIERSLDVLKPGGLAIHTTEYNFAHDDLTIDNWGTVLFLRKHFQQVFARLTALGHQCAPLDLSVGNKPMDRFIDVPPYAHQMSAALAEEWNESVAHMKLLVDGFPATCFGIIIRKAGG